MSMNKRKQRTQALMQATARHRMAEQADNAIEQARFSRMVRSGVIVRDGQAENRLLNSEGGGQGKAGSRCL